MRDLPLSINIPLCICVYLLLGACTPIDPPPPTPTVTRPDMNEQLNTCIIAYLTSGDHQDIIDEGLGKGYFTYDSTNDQYAITERSIEFVEWGAGHGIPIADMRGDIVSFDECAYITLDPAAEALHQAREQAANDCLDSWINTYVTDESIEYGIDLGVITPVSDTSRYHADPRHPDFITWAWDLNITLWSDIREETIYGAGCPYK